MSSVKDKGYERVKIVAPAPAHETAPAPYVAPLSTERRGSIAHAAELIQNNFTWSETPEGYWFWESVFKRLVQISRTGDHRE